MALDYIPATQKAEAGELPWVEDQIELRSWDLVLKENKTKVRLYIQ